MRIPFLGPAVLVLLAACGSDVTGPASPQEGVYTLVSVGGAPLPAVLPCSDCVRQVVTTGSLELGADGHYHLSWDGHDDLGLGPWPVDVEGAYAVRGHGINLHFGPPDEGETAFAGTWSDGAVTLQMGDGKDRLVPWQFELLGAD